MASFTRRIVETARLKPLAYEEVEADVRERTWWHPPVVVTLASIGMGAAQFGVVTPLSAFYSVVLGFAGWLLWSGIAFGVGVRVLPSRTTYATWGELLRTTAFATEPGILGSLGLRQGANICLRELPEEELDILIRSPVLPNHEGVADRTADVAVGPILRVHCRQRIACPYKRARARVDGQQPGGRSKAATAASSLPKPKNSARVGFACRLHLPSMP